MYGTLVKYRTLSEKSFWDAGAARCAVAATQTGLSLSQEEYPAETGKLKHTVEKENSIFVLIAKESEVTSGKSIQLKPHRRQ